MSIEADKTFALIGILEAEINGSTIKHFSFAFKKVF